MVRFEPEVKKTFGWIAGGTALCTVILWVIFAALQLAGLTVLNGWVLLSSLLGAAVAVGNFFVLCVTGQQVVEVQDEDKRKKMLRLSYNTRMLVQAVWVVLCIAVDVFQPVAGIAPLLFPRVTIYYLQITGKYQKQSPRVQPVEEIDATQDEAAAEQPGDEGGET